MVQLWIFLLAAALAAGCNGDGYRGPTVPPPPGDATELPLEFILTGTASATSGGVTASCRLDLIFELEPEISRTASLVEYRGLHGGEVERSLLESDGSGVSFHATVHGVVEARLFIPGRVELLFPANVDVESRFWRNLARFEGTADRDGWGRGSWTCAPIDVNSGGYVDTTVMAQGTWEFRPQEVALGAPKL